MLGVLKKFTHKGPKFLGLETCFKEWNAYEVLSTGLGTYWALQKGCLCSPFQMYTYHNF